MRVIVDNDFAGDPDDLFQLAHHLLSPSVDLRAVISSHLAPGDGFDPGPHAAANGARRVRELADVMGVDLDDLLVVGTEDALVDERTPQPSPGVDVIVAEALREDTTAPLFVVCGGGLTEIASAYLVEPSIADRLTVVWIGGPEDPELADAPPGAPVLEYNLGIDVTAGRVLLASPVPLWQVPRDAYRQCLVSDAELRARVAPAGPLGAYLYREIVTLQDRLVEYLGGRRETYALGDQPLVLATALQSAFEPDASSSSWVRRRAPRLGPDGGFVADPDGREIRVLTRVDTRLMFEDMFLKLAEHAVWATREAGAAETDV
ncbi:nucleoside hydrolase [Cellulomonas soli]|uniref:nucleoside hydrolase n=1 Tax=Cellulomonas soli TaxID=931535 RepID=UPI0017BC95E5|nr:nucleoside hydrolase [Cellulomonas soli]NYI57687.1 inosine-uridine nucleoside N-ribohydrolase [Cellulomonas soli]